MIEKFTEDVFNLHYFSIHRKCALYELFCSKSYTEDGEGIWIHRHSVQKKKNIYLSDKFLSHFMRKLHKPSLRGDL